MRPGQQSIAMPGLAENGSGIDNRNPNPTRYSKI